MAPTERESSREVERQVRHQHSASFDLRAKALIPMWDSSDPERAPPPLPLNPQSPKLTSRAGTSSAIQSAHAALTERVRDSAPSIPSSPTKRANDASPERALVRGGSHRRMQSMQLGTVRDLSLMIEASSSSSISSRPTTPTSTSSEAFARSPSKDSSVSSLGPGPSLTPIIRPTVRRLHTQSILSENTPPPSSTVLALQTMSPPTAALKEADAPLANITNGKPQQQQLQQQPKGPQTLDSVSSQILQLTSIAKSLQKEMAALSRRSRDNATDLLSLKQATNSRDEDIRKSIRDLVGRVDDQNERLSIREPFSSLLLEDKPQASSPSTTKSARAFQLPPITSPSFAESFDHGSGSGSGVSSVDATAILSLLEQILRGVGTKDGQASLVNLLTQLSKQVSGMATSDKVDELAQYVRSQTQSALVAVSSAESRALAFENGGGAGSRDMEVAARGGPMTQRMERLLNNNDKSNNNAPASRGAELVNDDLMNIIKSVKDSVSQGGGLTAEVKALVRELRGEVLGMGRELAKRLEHVERDQVDEADDDQLHRKDDVSRVIDEGLTQMKEQLSTVLREHRRQSASSLSSQKTMVDYQEIYNAMRAALRDNEASTRDEMPDLNRDDVIEAVREAWENYKPEVDVVQNAGLERDEIMACLKEGLQEYQPENDRFEAATRDEVFTAVVEGLKHYVPPQVDTPASLSRDEIIEAVRDCLEEFEFPVAASAIGNDMTHENMVHAVKEGLNSLDMPHSRGLSGEDNEEIMSRLQDIMEYMKLEFRVVSEEAKDNIAANGRDTEQVLDATKDGLETLRAAMETYMDRASGVSGQEEFIEHLTQSFEELKEEVARIVTDASQSSREQLQTELEGLREVVNTSMVPATPQQGSNKDVIETLQNGLSSLRQDLLRPRPETSEILDALNDGLNDIRAGIDRITNKPVDLTANDEIIDTIKSGLDSVRSDIETLRDNANEQAVAAVATVDDSPMDRAMIPLDTAKQDDIKNLEVLITQLRIKVEAMEPEAETVRRDDLSHLEEMIRDVQQGVNDIGARETSSSSAAARDLGEESSNNADAASRDDVQAIETILRNTKDRLDEFIDSDQAVRKEHLDTVIDLINEHKDTVGSLSERLDATSRKEDFGALEEILAQVIIGLDELKEKQSADDVDDDQKVTKTDVEAIEARVLEIRTALDSLSDMDFAAISNKEDVAGLETLIKEAKEQIDLHGELSAKAQEDRQAEVVGLSDRVAEVKTFLEEFQEAVQVKLDDGSTGVEALGKLLETMGEKMDKNENVGQDLKEMFDTMKAEFQISKEVVAGARLESDEKLQEATDGISTKIEDKIGELIAKYDEFQAIMDERSQAGEARDTEMEAAVVSAKAVSEDLKLLIDTLGSTVTDSLEKMEEASKTVFERVEELATRSDESRADGQTEHQQTRDHFTSALTAVETLQVEMKDFQPQILEAVKDILMLVGQHYEHSKSSVSDIQEKLVDTKPMIEHAMLTAPPEKYDDAEVRERLDRLVEQKYDDAAVRERLDRLVEEKYDDSELKEKLDRIEQRYNESTINEKLDLLADHTSSTTEAFAQLATLDKVHQTVVETAAQMSEFLSNQTERIADQNDDRERNLQDAEIALERKLAEKDHAEASLMSLRDEEERLRNSVVTLRTEQESLIRQRTRLTGDVSSLETAMRLRREELADMESRAERLERRIVDGVMDHSRLLLMGKSNATNRDNMNRKRVKKPSLQESELSRGSPKPIVNMALSRRSIVPSSQNGTARRIASLSQMNSGLSSAAVKRSQSVRSPAGGNSMRKRSWGGALTKKGVEDKENLTIGETLEEAEESSTPSPPREIVLLSDGHGGSSLVDDDDDDEQQHSDADTMRRTSNGTTIISASDHYTESDLSYSEYDDTASVWTESVVGGRSSYGAVEESGMH